MAIKQPDDENRPSRAPDGAQIQAKLGPEMPGDIRTKPSLGSSPGIGAAVPGFLGRLFAGATTNVSTQTELQNGPQNGRVNGLSPALEPPTDDPSGLPVIPGRPVKADATPDVMMSNLPEGYLKNLMARAQSGDDVALELLGGNFPGASGTDNEAVRKRKEKEAQEDFYRDALRRMLEDIDRRMEELAQRIADLKHEIEGIKAELKEIAERHASRQLMLEHFYKNGDFSLDREGRLKNKKWEEELRLIELRTGKKIDRNDPQSVFFALRREEEYAEEYRKNRQHRLGEAEKELTEAEIAFDEESVKKESLQQNEIGSLTEETKRISTIDLNASSQQIQGGSLTNSYNKKASGDIEDAEFSDDLINPKSKPSNLPRNGI